MRTCETCGTVMGEDHPYTVCPHCLFNDALASARPTVAGPGIQFPTRSGPDLTRHLAVRRDFFQKYEILELIAQGGQAEIWRVWDIDFRRCVAMKRLVPEASGVGPAVCRFLVEAQIASQLEHPGILPIFDVGLDLDGRPFYTTQLLPGMTLAEAWQREGDSALHRRLELLVRVCEIVGYAHNRGVIHRDLKPSNVLVGPHGDVRVIDWGSARVLETARNNFEEAFIPLDQERIQTARPGATWAEPQSPFATTSAGQPVTILFTPPEILSGQHEQVGPATDVYSTGVILYQLLAGRPPYSGPEGSLPEPDALRTLIQQGEPSPLREVNPSVSRDLAAVCRKAMSRSQADRYGNMDELADDLRAVREVRPVRARKPGPLLRIEKWILRNLSYVIMAAACVLVICLILSVTRSFKVERDVAKQVTALRSAELAARSGRWRESLKHWDEAEAAGYADSVYLALQQAEAWTVLNEPARSGAILRKLAARSNLGLQRAVVLLRLGEHELFDTQTAHRGVQDVREALAAGLSGADLLFAKGLLADSTPEALELFQQALQLNPYHHGAHRLGMGLEFLLGRHQELEAHIRVFKVLYPDDPSPGCLEASELALRGHLSEAQAKIEPLREAMNAAVWMRLDRACRTFATISEHYDVEAFLNTEAAERIRRTQPTVDALGLFAGGPFLDATNAVTGIRIPQLPCVRQGLIEGSDAIRNLMIPFIADIESSIQSIKSSCRHNPEAFVPVFAGILLESRHPTNGIKSLPLLQLQAELFQLAADSPSVLPDLGRLARLLAAKAEFELSGAGLTNSPGARRLCLENIQRAIDSRSSAAECRAYFDYALDLGSCEPARSLLQKWEQQQPENPAVLRARVRLETAMDSLGPALKLIDRLLVQVPNDDWALKQRADVRRKMSELLDATPTSTKTNPPTP